jgi:monovalent cation/hydrogen antiporter
VGRIPRRTRRDERRPVAPGSASLIGELDLCWGPWWLPPTPLRRHRSLKKFRLPKKIVAGGRRLAASRTLANGSPFSQRALIIFLTFSVIFVTLVVQGLTLPIVIRALGIGGSAYAQRRTAEARRLVIQSALAHLGRMQDASPEFAEIEQDIARALHANAWRTSARTGRSRILRTSSSRRDIWISRQLLNVEREGALRLLREGRISNEALREIERNLDLSVVRLNTVQQPPPV